MAYLPKEKYGKKLLYHHSAGAIATALLSFVVVALYAATYFLPYQGFTELLNQPNAITGVELFKYVINAFSGQLTPESLSTFGTEMVNNIFDGNGIALVSYNVYLYIMTFFLALIGIFAVVLFFASLVLLFKGSLKNWRLPLSMAKAIFGWGFFVYAPICLLNAYNGFVKGLVMPGSTSPTLGAVYPCFFTYGIYGLLFILCIILSIIYHKAFKNHVYVKDAETLNRYIEEYEKENVAVDLTAKEDIEKMEEEVEKVKEEKPLKPQPSEEVAKENILIELPKPVKEAPVEKKKADPSNEASKHLPKGIKVIGGHAFSQNTVLEDADIPEGVDVLGSGAFSNCVNLRRVHLPLSLKKIEYNCFFNCMRLEKITYAGTRENWRKIKRGSNWLTSAGTNIVNCIDGAIAVDKTK